MNELDTAEDRSIALAIEQVADAIVITDAAGKILYTNAAFTALTGYPRQEAIGRSMRFLRPSRQRKGFYEQLWARMRAGETRTGDMLDRRKDGSTYTAETTITPVRNAAGETIRYIAVSREVTERRARADRRRPRFLENRGRRHRSRARKLRRRGVD